MTRSANALWAPVKWAQRKDSLYVTIDLPDVKDEQVKLNDKTLTFQGKSNGNEYEVELNFLKEIDSTAKESKWAVQNRSVQFYIMKKNKEDEFWPRLLEDKHLEKTNVSVDWNKYVDEDEEEEKGGFDMSGLSGGGNFDINQMMAQQAAFGEGKLPDDEEEEADSDDEDLPDLQPASEES